jgi:N-acetylglucosaminyl-diphospho-decaprenol L-rhamnosyltransferase
MSSGLKRLIPQLIEQKYDHIYVLDDCSNDDSKTIAQSFGTLVSFIQGKSNRGGGAARNLIIGQFDAPTIIHFIDADVSLQSSDIPKTLRGLDWGRNTSFITGLVLNSNNIPSVWNYGPRQNIVSFISGGLTFALDNIESRLGVRMIYGILYNRPNPHKVPVAKQIFWGVETNLAILSTTLEALGGFDETIREHDIQPLAIKASKRNLIAYFDPSFAVINHDDIHVRSYNRNIRAIKAEAYIVSTYSSWQNWFFPFKNP